MNLSKLLLDSILVFELVAALVAVYSYQKTKSQTVLKLAILLVVVIIVETYGTISNLLEYENNVVAYNLLGLVELGIYSSIYYPRLTKPWQKKFVGTLFALCVLALLINLVTKNPMTEYLHYGFGLVSFYISCLACIYLLNLARDPKVFHISHNMLVWISFGLLAYHLGTLPITILTNIIEPIDSSQLLQVVMALPSIIMYSCFINGLIWARKKYSF